MVRATAARARTTIIKATMAATRTATASNAAATADATDRSPFGRRSVLNAPEPGLQM
jgi:hypothetical protein